MTDQTYNAALRWITLIAFALALLTAVLAILQQWR